MPYLPVVNTHIEHHGRRGWWIGDIGAITTDYTGLMTATTILKSPWQDWLEIPDIGSYHPNWGNVLRMHHREVDIKNGYATARCEYIGIGGQITTPVYSFQVSPGEEPIATHPLFGPNQWGSGIGGTPKNPQNGAVFRNPTTGAMANGRNLTTSTNRGFVFDHFECMVGESDSNINPFAGVTSYLELSQITWRQTYNRLRGVPDTYPWIGYAGQIDPDPPGVAELGFSLAAPRNWLFMGASISIERGDVLQITKEWRGSGRRGWNNIIYLTIGQ